MRQLEAGLLAVCLALSGCIGAMAQGAPAQEHRSTADEQAYADQEGAELLSISGAEANESWSEDDRGGEWSGNASMHDERIGDGGAPFWVYEYRLDNATLEVVVDEDGEVVEKERIEDVDEDQPAIEDWEVSSIEAVEIAQENEDEWTVSEDGMAFYHLERENETSNPVWSLAEFVDDGLVWARVDASTGEHLGSGAVGGSWTGWSGWGGWNGSWGGGWDHGPDGSSDEPYQEGGGLDGEVTATEPTAEHTFEVDQRGHPELGVELALDDPATSTVTATVSHGGEELGTIEATADDSAQAEWWDDPRPGEYTITVELQGGASQGYTINWCAEGESYQGGDNPYGPDDVCDAVDGERGGPGLAAH